LNSGGPASSPARLLFPLVQNWPIPGTSSQTPLVRREGEKALWMNTLRFSEAEPLSLSLPLDKNPDRTAAQREIPDE
jgi:hypothetical protein